MFEDPAIATLATGEAAADLVDATVDEDEAVDEVERVLTELGVFMFAKNELFE